MNDPILKCTDVTLNINGNYLLNNVSLSIDRGECLLMVGENGAGKTTFINILCGIHKHGNYSGRIVFNDKDICFSNPSDALHAGIIAIHQETNLYDNLSIADNLFYLIPGVNKHSPKAIRVASVNEFLKKHNYPLDSSRDVSELSNAEKRIIEIIRLYLLNPFFLILDEPTAPLGTTYDYIVCQLIEHFKKLGVAILLISHEYSTFLPLVDKVTVLRDSRVIATLSHDEFLNKDIVKLSWGNLWKNRYPKINISLGKEVLALEDVSTRDESIRNISLALHKQEILGIYGRVGSGKSVLARAIFGCQSVEKGQFFIDRLPAKLSSTKDAMHLGIAYITDERMEQGLYPNLSAVENAFSLRDNKDSVFVNSNREKKQFTDYSKRLNVAIKGSRTVQTLSGGEQQKILLMKWLMSSSNIFLLDDPTQSLDIPSKIDIYNLCNDLVLKGKSIIIFSSTLEELLGICDRTLFLKKGIICDEVSYEESDRAKKWLEEN